MLFVMKTGLLQQTLQSNKLLNYLEKSSAENSVKIHKGWQKTILNVILKNTIEKVATGEKTQKIEVRGNMRTTFDWKNKWFLCGKDCLVDRKHPSREQI